MVTSKISVLSSQLRLKCYMAMTNDIVCEFIITHKTCKCAPLFVSLPLYLCHSVSCVCFALIHLVSNNVSSIFHNETFILHFMPDVMTSIYTHDLITNNQEKIYIHITHVSLYIKKNNNNRTEQNGMDMEC